MLYRRAENCLVQPPSYAARRVIIIEILYRYTCGDAR